MSSTSGANPAPTTSPSPAASTTAWVDRWPARGDGRTADAGATDARPAGRAGAYDDQRDPDRAGHQPAGRGGLNVSPGPRRHRGSSSIRSTVCVRSLVERAHALHRRGAAARVERDRLAPIRRRRPAGRPDGTAGSRGGLQPNGSRKARRTVRPRTDVESQDSGPRCRDGALSIVALAVAPAAAVRAAYDDPPTRAGR